MASRINSTRNTRLSNRGLNGNKPSILGLQSNNENANNVQLGLKDQHNLKGGLKRKADLNMDNILPTKKRSVLGDVTNAIEKTISNGRKASKFGIPKKSTGTSKNIKKDGLQVKKLAPAKGVLASVSELPKEKPTVKMNKRRSERTSLALAEQSLDAELAADLSYCSALPSSQEPIVSLARRGPDSSAYVTASESSPIKDASMVEVIIEEDESNVSKEDSIHIPNGVEDYDTECLTDPFAVSLYASDIFKYYKLREKSFPIEKYLSKQTEITESMRSVLVDWMVEVQESFELNHETLYLAVKLVDFYLSKVVIKREQLQLVGCTAVFIACKFDERIPPYVDDFLYICDDAYRRRELLLFEMKMLKAIGFDLGLPLSYRYLRRYARCGKVSMEELTLARFILEMSLMEYNLIDAADHVIAGAALLLARYVTAGEEQRKEVWNPTLQYYSGLAVSDLQHLTHTLHAMLTRTPREHLATVRNKYSHPVFYEVAKIAVPETLDL